MRGDFNKFDDRFSNELQGNQCTAISFLAACYHLQKSITEWKLADINDIVTIGDDLYQAIIGKLTKIESKYLNLE